jgi:hypothetical protein
VYSHSFRQLEFVIDWSLDFLNFKGSKFPEVEFFAWSFGFDVASP